MTDAVLTNVKGEVLHQGSPQPRVTNVKAEVLHHGTAQQRLTNVKAEVLHRMNNLAAPAHRRITVVVTGV